MRMTDSQQRAFDNVAKFLATKIIDTNAETFTITVSGYAGTGKTTLTKQILNYARGTLKMNVVAVAPTHKAVKVLDRVLNTNTFMMVNTMTVASLLSRVKGHSYIGTKRYVSDGNHKLNMFDLFIIDEVSMIADQDYDEIVELARALQKKIIFIGDSAQIPNPSQQMIVQEGELIKPDSKAFSVPNLQELTEIVRQRSDNPLLSISAMFRDNKCGPVTIPRISAMSGSGDGILFIDKQSEFIDKITTSYDSATSRIVAYTNESVKNYNKIVRCALGRDHTDFVVGELIMGYVNSDWIQNGQDYKVIDLEKTDKHTVTVDEHTYCGLKGLLVGLKDMDYLTERHVFLPDVYEPCNLEVLEELIRRAEKVNEVGSTKKDYGH